MPASITYLMFGMVREVSATLVARMILLLSPATLLVSNTLCCSADDNLPYKGRTSTPVPKEPAVILPWIAS